MAEQLPERPSDGHPIAAGFAALVGVALVIGLILGLVVLAGTKVLGLGDESQSTTPDSERSMYLPTPEKTAEAGEPEITLGSGSSAKPAEPGVERVLEAQGDQGAREEDHPNVRRPDLGRGDAADRPDRHLHQRRGRDPAGPAVRGRSLGGLPGHRVGQQPDLLETYIQTSQPGVNRIRMIDTDTREFLQRGQGPDRLSAFLSPWPFISPACSRTCPGSGRVRPPRPGRAR